MYKVVSGTRVSFFDDNDNEIMYIDYLADECIWYFRGSEEITVIENDELFKLLSNIIWQQYDFNSDSLLKSYKDNNKLVWYSDCYYNPDDEWSVNSVSYLTIVYENNLIKLKCIKPLDVIINREDKSHVIGFSPSGNGKYTKNKNTGLTLQDDFVIKVYQELLKKEKVKRKSHKYLKWFFLI